ncbi:MAG: hypothetical protein A4S09_13200 [Proteobacteria bacterium SG_bin7]|nr:MAG: hypothetical protein A4S09_13200 [Proteobacteria bacterium SG_bin7]
MRNLIGLLIFLISSSTLANSWNGKIFRVSDRAEVSYNDFVRDVSDHRYVIIGENHMTTEVQDAEARTINDVINFKKENFVFAWEFLAYSQQPLVDRLWDSFVSGKLTGEEFIKATLYNPANNTYIPILKTVAENGGELIGINLTREEKAPVTKGGIKAADPKIVPSGYEIGGADYYKRFQESMDGHTTPDKISNYFDAQCLTDDVMANELSRISADKVFVIAGHFHTDYFDGFVSRANVRIPNQSKIVIRILDASKFKEEELMEQLVHVKYGNVADYAYFVKEPIAANQK